MRLLQRGVGGNLRFTQDLLPDDIPPYGILSHTWGRPEDEVTFHDLREDEGREKPGYKKILFAGEQAARDGLEYFWVDTCCIDKSNHTEYTEAINSMFRWYQNAAACYVYMSDVQTNSTKKRSWIADFNASRWFSRGWTLQELLAPSQVIFFSPDGQRLGDKKSLQTEIRERTKIPDGALEGAPLSTFSIDERMSWSNNRQTAKAEDIAYCLMGIFGVHMVPIYGEGESEAFERLKCEIHFRKTGDKELEEGFDQCIADLRVTDPRNDKSRIESTKGGLLKASYRWILEDESFKSWCENAEPLLWIKGNPGKGKTMLLCGLIDELSIANLPHHGRLVSYFFCQATDSNLNNALAVLRGLIYTIVRQDRALIKYVHDEWKIAGKGLFEDSNAFDALVMILDNILQHDTRAERVFIIDALDECSKDLPKLLRFITRQSLDVRAKWIVSSRDQPDIAERLEIRSRMAILNLELSTTRIAEAVSVYTRHKVTELQEMKGFTDNQRNEIIHYLDSNANETFLWVAMVCERLQSSKSWKILDDLKELPAGLNALYGRMVRYVEDSEDADLLFEVLSLISIAHRPMSLFEMAAILNVPSEIAKSEKILRELVGYCGSFLTIRDDLVYFIHQSAQDFLLHQAATSVFPDGIQKKHIYIALKSIKVLSGILKRDIYELGEPGISVSDIKTPSNSILVRTRYACTAWVDHLIDAEILGLAVNTEAFSVTGEVEGFLKTKFLYWIEALSLLGSISNTLRSLTKLLSSIQRDEAKDTLGRFVYDAQRFMYYHGAIIAKYPLQTYITGLLFSPTESITRKLFQHEEPRWVTINPPIRKNWGTTRQLLEGHNNTVNSVAFSADGQFIASGSSDDTVRIWSVESGECQQTFDKHGNGVYAVKYLDDGTLIAASADKVVCVNSSEEHVYHYTREHVYHYTREHRGPRVSAVSFSISCDGKLVALGLDDGNIDVLPVDNSGNRQTLQGHTGWVTALDFSPTGRLLASGADDKTVRFWSWPGGQCDRILEGIDSPVASIAFSADSKLIATGCSLEGTIRIWSVERGVCIRSLVGHSSEVRSLAFSQNSDLLVSGSLDKTVRLWSIASGEQKRVIETHHGGVSAVAFSPYGNLVASCGSAYIRISSLEESGYQGSPSNSMTVDEPNLGGQNDSVTCLAFSGKLVAAASLDCTLGLWSIDDPACQYSIKVSGGWINFIEFSPDAKFIGATTVNRTICVWSIDTSGSGGLRPFKTFSAHEEHINSLAFSSDSSRLATASDDRTVRVWPLIGDRHRFDSLKAHSGGVTAVALSQDLIVSGSVDQTVQIWHFDGSMYSHRWRLTGHNGCITSVAISSDSSKVASASRYDSIRIYSVDDGTCLHKLQAIPSSYLSFDIHGRLVTDSGIIAHQKPLMERKVVRVTKDMIETANKEPEERQSYRFGLGAGPEWLNFNESPLIWVPNEYRAFNNVFGISGPNMVWYYEAGQLLTLKFHLPDK
ncbi:unnamed protein product [Clonostachys rosea]|uniref:NACHT domain-containing protein n=1 Tax=Bionectria ochroleuca TaxID=29856 RepID=A0ABY6TZ64_BIOOC|nr:unnamed protein product [Clonostachys rosea]